MDVGIGGANGSRDRTERSRGDCAPGDGADARTERSASIESRDNPPPTLRPRRPLTRSTRGSRPTENETTPVQKSVASHSGPVRRGEPQIPAGGSISHGHEGEGLLRKHRPTQATGGSRVPRGCFPPGSITNWRSKLMATPEPWDLRPPAVVVATVDSDRNVKQTWRPARRGGHGGLPPTRTLANQHEFDPG